MNSTLKIIFLAPSLVFLGSCVSTAVGILDGVAAQGEKGLAVAAIRVDEDSCKQPPRAVGAVAMWEAQLTESVTINRIVNVCSKKYDIDVDRAEIEAGYREELRKRCDATLVRPEETNQYAKLSQVNLCKQLPEFEGMVN